jgi:hypothetical protein
MQLNPLFLHQHLSTYNGSKFSDMLLNSRLDFNNFYNLGRSNGQTKNTI